MAVRRSLMIEPMTKEDRPYDVNPRLERVDDLHIVLGKSLLSMDVHWIGTWLMMLAVAEDQKLPPDERQHLMRLGDELRQLGEDMKARGY